MVSTRRMRAPRTSPRKRTLKVQASSPTRLFKSPARRANLRLPPSPRKGAKHCCAKAMHACDMWVRRKRFDLDAMREVAAASRPKTEYEIAWMQRLQAIIQLMEQREAAGDQAAMAQDSVTSEQVTSDIQAPDGADSGDIQAPDGADSGDIQALEQGTSDIQAPEGDDSGDIQALEQGISDIQAPEQAANNIQPVMAQEPTAPETGSMQVVASASASQAPPPSALPVAHMPSAAPMAAHGGSSPKRQISLKNGGSSPKRQVPLKIGGSSPKRQIPLKNGSRILANRYGLRIKDVDNGRISFNPAYAYRGTIKTESGHFKDVYIVERAVVLALTPAACWVQSAYASGCGCPKKVRHGPDAKHAKGCCFADPVRAKAMAAYQQAGAPPGPLVQPEGPPPKGCVFLTADEASQFMTLQHSTVSFAYVIASGEVKYYGNKTQRLYDTRLRAAAMEARHVDDASA